MSAPQPSPALPVALTRFHRTRLMQIWRSAGWPCKDGLEIDLLAAGLVTLHTAPEGFETLKLTDEGIRTLAVARQRSVRALSGHDRLAQKFAAQLLAAGRIVWTELSLRAVIEGASAPPLPAATEASPPTPGPAMPPLWSDDDTPAARAAANVWRMARPDLFSVRNTSVPAYLQPMVHEIKYSRADLLSDLRHDAKRQAYQWLCEECYYVFPVGIAEPEEIPEHFGIWVLHGGLDDKADNKAEGGSFELLRPARHAQCTLPFAVWLALCKATPLRGEGAMAQAQLGEPCGEPAGDMTDMADPCIDHTQRAAAAATTAPGPSTPSTTPAATP